MTPRRSTGPRPRTARARADAAPPPPPGAVLRLRELREQAGLTVEQLAERAGVRAATVSDLENGRATNPTLETLVKLGRALGVHVTWLFAPPGAPAPEPRPPGRPPARDGDGA